ncbi:hypothetical protein HK102_013727, partial [Quaeritorhiza haematococci]
MAATTITAKVAYNGLLRVFELNAENPIWADFEAQVRRLHSISADVPIIASYRDEDGDVISLDTDRELVEYVGRIRRQGGRHVRFQVMVRDPDTTSFVLIANNNNTAPTSSVAASVATSSPSRSASPSPSASASMQSAFVEDSVAAAGNDSESEDLQLMSVDDVASIGSGAATGLYPNLSEFVNPEKEKAEQVSEEDTSETKENAARESSASGPEPASSQQQEERAGQGASIDPAQAFLDAIGSLVSQISAEIEAHPEVFQRIGETITAVADQAQVHIGAAWNEFHRQWTNHAAAAAAASATAANAAAAAATRASAAAAARASAAAGNTSTDTNSTP